LLAPRVSPDGRDSLGRGLDAQSVSLFVSNDKAVQRERQAVSTWLQTAYRDPSEATKRLDALIRREGFASVARRIESDPAQLGAYAGKTGLFAGAAAALLHGGFERRDGTVVESFTRRVRNWLARVYAFG
jgi:hypothetical protein